MTGVSKAGARAAGQFRDCSYSLANKNFGLVWDEQILARYLRAASEVAPGTKMIFSGLKKSHEVSDVIAHLKQLAANGKQARR